MLAIKMAARDSGCKKEVYQELREYVNSEVLVMREKCIVRVCGCVQITAGVRRERLSES